MSLEFIRLGDKLDINYLHQNNGKTYKSSVYDILSDTELEITMPTDEGKMVLLQNGFECQFYFYTSRGLYTCEAVITGRAKKENFFLLTAEIKTGLKKFQRREYYRVSSLIDFMYYKIDDKVAELETTEELFDVIATPEYQERKNIARTKDISGGGIKFIGNEPLDPGEKVLVVIRLENDKLDKMFYLVSEVVECFEVENLRDKWIIRVRFIFKDIKDRDLIVRYVFEEDRMIRKKENG